MAADGLLMRLRVMSYIYVLLVVDLCDTLSAHVPLFALDPSVTDTDAVNCGLATDVALV
jgi:hypothetical protein